MRLASLLALLLALTGIGQAVAQARMAGATEVALCSEAGAVTRVLDGAGREVLPPQDCLDCLLPALAVLPPGAAPSAPASPSERLRPVGPLAFAAQVRPAVRARGPPPPV